MHQTLRFAAGAAAIAAIGVSFALAPSTPRNPTVEALALCGDTPATHSIEHLQKFEPNVVIEPKPEAYALAVKSVDDCRRGVLEHFK
ncbi:hypothetical protein IB276_33090 [Ensifer sp. ENS04]|uniref:hypothetical protein n=1 Tax=Ensifer sp. ENS04 TaxID=2769281 RepID=UPI001781FED7|nr:hypothetical protein [Ensifer sp. ENS04]MBD9544283.1 hypothetical protein [Ensifer sp. ENS04]